MSATLAVAELFALCRQQAYVLRHTFASHFIQNGGNILTLQKILGLQLGHDHALCTWLQSIWRRR